MPKSSLPQAESVNAQGERKKNLKSLYNVHNQDLSERRNALSEARPETYSDI